MREREVCRIERSGRPYHIIVNRYPVMPRHFVAVRPAAAPAASLPQYLQEPAEIEDLLSCVRAAGPSYRGYFNSNSGADGSRSGSSVNHWHFQFFAYPGERTPLEERPAPASPAAGGAPGGAARVVAGSEPSWPARHRFLEGAEDAEIARVLWPWIEELNRLNVAYNLEARALSGGSMRVFLFPRRPAPDTEVPALGALSSNFGGCELSGDVVISEERLFAWHRCHPGRAEKLTESRLRATTRDIGW